MYPWRDPARDAVNAPQKIPTAPRSPSECFSTSRGEMPLTGTPTGSGSPPGRPPVDPSDLGAYAAEVLPEGWGAGQIWSLEPSRLPVIHYTVVPSGGISWDMGQLPPRDA
jgi:hypothetical protein